MTAARFRIAWTTEAGELVAIEPRLDEVAQHAAELAAGYNHPGNATLLGHSEPLSEAEVADHYAAMIEQAARPFLLFLDGNLAGDADLRGLRDRAAEFAFLITSPGRQGRGLGTRFATMISAFGFEKLGLDRIYASLVPHNAASRRVFEKLGYAVDESPEARRFADDPGDLTMAIDRSTFARLHSAALAELRIEER